LWGDDDAATTVPGDDVPAAWEVMAEGSDDWDGSDLA
jgi:hypothetical protein